MLSIQFPKQYIHSEEKSAKVIIGMRVFFDRHDHKITIKDLLGNLLADWRDQIMTALLTFQCRLYLLDKQLEERCTLEGMMTFLNDLKR